MAVARSLTCNYPSKLACARRAVCRRLVEPREFLRLVEPPSMALLRVALLCHLCVSVAGADRSATNLVCLPDEPDQVDLSFAGASATAFLKDIP